MTEKKTPAIFLTDPKIHKTLKKLVSNHITIAGMEQAFKMAIDENPDSFSMFTYLDIIKVFVKSFECGLLPNTVHKHAFVIPYKGKTPKIDFQISYLGLIELCNRNGMTINSGIVYEKDVMTYKDGVQLVFEIDKCTDAERGAITHFWALTIQNDRPVIEVMTADEVNEIKKKVIKKDIWNSHFGEMGRKTVIKRLCKKLPLSKVVMKAIDYDNQDEVFEPVEDFKAIIAPETLEKLQAHIDNGDIAFGKDVVDAMRICEQFKVKSLAELTETQAKNILANFVVINSESEETNSESEENKNA